MIDPQLIPLATPIHDLKFDPKNARKHSKRNLDTIKNSLREFGQRLPIIAHADTKVVIAGNARLRAARELGWDKIAVVFVTDSEIQSRRFGLIDNRAAELAEWDFDVLSSVLRELADNDTIEIESLGFLDDEINPLIIEDDDLSDKKSEKKTRKHTPVELPPEMENSPVPENHIQVTPAAPYLQILRFTKEQHELFTAYISECRNVAGDTKIPVENIILELITGTDENSTENQAEN